MKLTDEINFDELPYLKPDYTIALGCLELNEPILLAQLKSCDFASIRNVKSVGLHIFKRMQGKKSLLHVCVSYLTSSHEFQGVGVM